VANLGLTVAHSLLIHICSVLLYLSGGILVRVPTLNSLVAVAFPLKNPYVYHICSLVNDAQ
jgi:hypothetical protein